MPADQAAGLRRRNARQPLCCIYCFSEHADTSVRLAQALHQIGRVTLLIDTQDRLFTASSPRSLFDWRHQLAHRQLHTLPLACGEGWHAPGVRADEPALPAVAARYDDVLFDLGWLSPDFALLPGAAHTVVMDVRRTGQSMQHAYAVLKTIASSGGIFAVYMLGDGLACDRVRAAARHFLGRGVADTLCSVANEDDAFAAHAVRMAGEETSLSAC